MLLLDGKATSIAILEELRSQTAQLVAEKQPVPHLVAMLIGDQPASETYVAHKIKACEKVGFRSTLDRLPNTISEPELLSRIETYNQNPDVTGILVQLPLPAQIDANRVIDAIAFDKDVDGFHPTNLGLLAQNRPFLRPATPAGIVELLRRHRIETMGKHVVVIGRSNIVGTPISLLLSRDTAPGNATVTLCHSRTQNLPDITRQADILIAAAGQPEFIGPDQVKDEVVIVDVGIHRKEDASRKRGYRLVGDVQFEALREKARAMTPVPGGVGPMTIASLLQNTLQAHQQQQA